MIMIHTIAVLRSPGEVSLQGTPEPVPHVSPLMSSPCELLRTQRSDLPSQQGTVAEGCRSHTQRLGTVFRVRCGAPLGRPRISAGNGF